VTRHDDDRFLSPILASGVTEGTYTHKCVNTFSTSMWDVPVCVIQVVVLMSNQENMKVIM